MTNILRPQYIGNLLFLIDLDNTLFLTDKANNLAYEKAIKDMLNKHNPNDFFEKILSLSNGRIMEDTFYLLDICKEYPFLLSRCSPYLGPSGFLFGTNYDSRYLMDFDNKYPLFFSYSKVNEILKNQNLEEFFIHNYDTFGISSLTGTLNQYDFKIKIQKLVDIIKNKKDEYYTHFLFTINNKSDDIFNKIRDIKEKRVELVPYWSDAEYCQSYPLDLPAYMKKEKKEKIEEYIEQEKIEEYIEQEKENDFKPKVYIPHGYYPDFKSIKIIVTKANKNRAKQILEYYDLTNRFDGLIFCGKEENKYEKALNELCNLMNENNISYKDVYIFDDDENQINNIRERLPNENIFII